MAGCTCSFTSRALYPWLYFLWIVVIEVVTRSFEDALGWHQWLHTFCSLFIVAYYFLPRMVLHPIIWYYGFIDPDYAKRDVVVILTFAILGVLEEALVRCRPEWIPFAVPLLGCGEDPIDVPILAAFFEFLHRSPVSLIFCTYP